MDIKDNLVPMAAPAPMIAPLPMPSRIPVRAQAPSVIEARGFTWADILWAVGIWSVIVCLSPVILFYMLMVA